METHNQPITDESLLLAGTEVAMTRLVGRYERPLFRFLFNLTGDAHLAEDLFQETFMRLHRARDRFQPGGKLKAYIYRIALNVARDASVRTAKEKRNASLNGNASPGNTDHSGQGEQALPLKDQLAGSDPDPGKEVEGGEMRGRVREAVRALPESEREVVLLRIFEGLTFIEIAAIAEVPLPTVKSRMRYALQRLRPVLETYLGGTA